MQHISQCQSLRVDRWVSNFFLESAFSCHDVSNVMDNEQPLTRASTSSRRAARALPPGERALIRGRRCGSMACVHRLAARMRSIILPILHFSLSSLGWLSPARARTSAAEERTMSAVTCLLSFVSLPCCWLSSSSSCICVPCICPTPCIPALSALPRISLHFPGLTAAARCFASLASRMGAGVVTHKMRSARIFDACYSRREGMRA